jgi:hypothetical protein
VIISFVKLCQFALVLNKTLIQPDQEEFQVQLEAGYENLKKELQVRPLHFLFFLLPLCPYLASLSLCP